MHGYQFLLAALELRLKNFRCPFFSLCKSFSSGFAAFFSYCSCLVPRIFWGHLLLMLPQVMLKTVFFGERLRQSQSGLLILKAMSERIRDDVRWTSRCRVFHFDEGMPLAAVVGARGAFFTHCHIVEERSSLRRVHRGHLKVSVSENSLLVGR